MALLLLAADVCHADSILDQSYDPSSSDAAAVVGLSNVVDWAQTFTVGTTGILTSVEVKIFRSPDDIIVDPLLFDVRSTNSGAPAASDIGSAILFSTSLSASSISTTAGFASVNLGSAAVPVSSGDVLAIVLRSDDSVNDAYHWKGTKANGYSGGGAFFRIGSGNWKSGTPADLAFKTNLTPTPEPGSIALFGLGALGAVWWRRRTRGRSR
ncbi:MAG: PEP-CTERM sorting domain-containing protein [Planctomycetota bacterium]